MTDQGYIDSTTNPFAMPSWVYQGYGLTDKRSACLARLFGKTVQAISQAGSPNENKYPAFVGVRWGFAKIDDDVLVPTKKWYQRHAYDERGYNLDA